jgi:hypothetical protein
MLFIADLILVNRIRGILHASCMGISAVTWRCPKCNQDVGGSLGELRYHRKRVHGNNTDATNEVQVDTGSD